MKTLLRLSTITLLVFTLAFEGCKKGENDPFLSLKSRKARVTGKWVMTSGEFTFSSTGFSETYILNGTTATGGGSTFPYAIETEFKKDGTFSRTTNEDGDIIIETGKWDFNSGVGESKKKDQIIMYTLTYSYDGDTETYSGTDAPVEYLMIDELRNKKMVLKFDGTYNDGSGSGTDTSKGFLTFESKN